MKSVIKLPLSDTQGGGLDLNDRQKRVLKGVCDAFIATGIPVGSRTISKFGSLTWSPATIRNEMADLETLGYLFSPHTSAGRVPTEKGYRFYVNFLLKFEQLSQIEAELMGLLAKKSRERQHEQEQVLKNAIKLACEMTKLGGIVVTPQKSHKSLRAIQLIRLLEDRLMLVTVDECGKIADQVVDIPGDLPDEDLLQITNFLNVQICNRKICEIEAELLRMSHELLLKYNSLLSTLTEKIKVLIDNPSSDAVFLEGFVNFFEQSEFKDPEKMRKMISLLDQKEYLLNLLAESLENGENIMVNIGTDSGLELPDLSIVTARYCGPNKSYGRIGLIGPLRMDYGRVVATLANISKTLSELFLGTRMPRQE